MMKFFSKKHQRKGAQFNKKAPAAIKQNAAVESAFIKWRYYIVIAVIFAAMAVLLARAVDLQINNADKMNYEADKRSLRTQALRSARGMILDRNGKWLSVSVEMYSLVADPKVIFEKGSLQDEARWKALADALKIPYKKIKAKISKNPKSRYIYLARQITPEVAKYARELKIQGVQLTPEFRRFYPKVEETAHLIGFTNIDGEGIEGIEKSFNKLLLGQDGSRTYRKDGQGNMVEAVDDTQKYDAHNVTLSIDDQLQSMAYRYIKEAVIENKAESGTIVLVDIRTGEVLAMANAPSYNPNNRNTTVKADLRRNRAITDTFEPGSTVKPFVVLTALQRGIVNKNSVLNTRPFTVNGHTIHDVANYDKLSIAGILQKSSNVGVSHLALAMPPTALVETYEKAGFGKATDLGLIGEQQGILPHRKRWADIERATISYGYGLMVTPIQLARAYVTLGSFGIYRPLSITKVDPPVIGTRVFPEKTTRDVIHMMETVALPGGGGVAAAVKGYRVAIKTGTAKKIEDGKYVNKYIAYTAGVAPASNPRFALVVLINEPKGSKYYGGAISAPVFSKVMEFTLRSQNIKPDAISENDTATRIIRLDQQQSAVATPSQPMN
ncbi:peptidoglycan glycosyltransferase FtsI [Pasteurellaceae bacterium TAE3-ERU1]|uniref:peptidoglycan glycosyltransferase FtsI n=1 Tax=Spirabiliibacterium mucosae TaxID=28156 RepID=UPI001AACC87F|nr:peptidoglycan glycosyltransferase FtsI [Spirabiliibacterium mucosae]MBE2898035.1 peptidoglycan glycosyltransferase FtsI [Spirabiliibacterium mucosae]MBV7387068.1 peptidoglycan glycosyltransferase FtsI [Pasteurellaceae bacterium TAE3-ERU1]